MLNQDDLLNLKPPFNEINLIVREDRNLKIYMSDKQQNVCITPSQSFLKKFLDLLDSSNTSNLIRMEHQETIPNNNYSVIANTNNLSYVMMNADRVNPILNFKNGYQFGMSPLKPECFNNLIKTDFISLLIKTPHTKNDQMEIFFNNNICEASFGEQKLYTNCDSNFTEFTIMDDQVKIMNEINNKKKTKFLMENL